MPCVRLNYELNSEPIILFVSYLIYSKAKIETGRKYLTGTLLFANLL